MNKLYIIGMTFGLMAASSGYAMDAGNCNHLFPNNQAPDVPSQVLNAKHVRPLCFSEFFVLYSVDSRTPVYAVEKLSYLTINIKTKRTNHFHEEPMLRSSERSSPKDYARSGYDKGHNANARDMHTALGMDESFSMSNMSPEVPNVNRNIWAKNVEEATRKYVKRAAGDIYVFTGNYFEPNHKTIGKWNSVWVPSAIYKLVYDSQTKRSWAYWVPNTADAKMTKPISYEELVARTGIHFLNR